jgi:nitrogenase-stabilizing/protective protein
MSDVELTLDEALEDLSSAEDFLEFFAVPYDPAVVHVNRLHILQRYHDYIGKQGPAPAGDEAARAFYTEWLTRAYSDFVTSDSLTERVFVVLKKAAGESFVPLTNIMGTGPAPDSN